MPEINEKKNDSSARFREIRAILRKYHVTRGITPEKLRQILEDLGPTYVKLGQIMSLHSDILPKRYCDELMKLTSDVDPMPFSDVLDVLTHSYRCDPYEIFRTIEENPLGSASIAQVHRASLKSGEEVVVKVQRKGIYDTMARDIGLLHRLVSHMPPVGGLADVADFDMVLDEMWSVAQEEMDFLKEAANMQEFRKLNRDILYVYVPELFREYTTDRVLVMEYVDGIAIDDAEALLGLGYDLDEIGAKFVDNYIKQIMDDGFFHADPHPGNVKIRDGKIVWLDMGMMGRLTERLRQIMGRGVKGIALHDVRMVEEAVIELGDFQEPPNRRKLYEDLRNYLDKYGSENMGDISISTAVLDMFDVMKNNGIALPHGVTMLGRSLAQMEGVFAKISPDISMSAIAEQRVTQQMFHDIDWRDELTTDGRRLWRSMSKSVEIPGLATDALKEYLSGESRMNLRLNLSQPTVVIIRAAVRNLVIGMCIAALLVGSAILCTTDMSPKIFGIPALGFLGFFIATMATAFFTLRFFWETWLRKRVHRRRKARKMRKRRSGSIPR